MSNISSTRHQNCADFAPQPRLADQLRDHAALPPPVSAPSGPVPAQNIPLLPSVETPQPPCALAYTSRIQISLVVRALNDDEFATRRGAHDELRLLFQKHGAALYPLLRAGLHEPESAFRIQLLMGENPTLMDEPLIAHAKVVTEYVEQRFNTFRGKTPPSIKEAIVLLAEIDAAEAQLSFVERRLMVQALQRSNPKDLGKEMRFLLSFTSDDAVIRDPKSFSYTGLAAGWAIITCGFAESMPGQRDATAQSLLEAKQQFCLDLLRITGARLPERFPVKDSCDIGFEVARTLSRLNLVQHPDLPELWERNRGAQADLRHFQARPADK